MAFFILPSFLVVYSEKNSMVPHTGHRSGNILKTEKKLKQEFKECYFRYSDHFVLRVEVTHWIRLLFPINLTGKVLH